MRLNVNDSYFLVMDRFLKIIFWTSLYHLSLFQAYILFFFYKQTWLWCYYEEEEGWGESRKRVNWTGGGASTTMGALQGMAGLVWKQTQNGAWRCGQRWDEDRERSWLCRTLRAASKTEDFFQVWSREVWGDLLNERVTPSKVYPSGCCFTEVS